MPSKLQLYAQLADQTAQQITGSLQAWTGFLSTAARLYKYPFHEQLMIYAQRPEATACADYELWNNTMHRYVRRGSRGIALIDTSGDSPRLRYVFDVSDTGGGEKSRRPYLWEYRDEHHDAVTAALERRFDVDAVHGMEEQLERITARLVDEYWNENRFDILGIVDGSYLEDYDDFNIGAAFRNAAVVSTTYALLSRCGLEPEGYFAPENFSDVFDFNTPATVAALGAAVSQTSEQVLRQIEATIRNYERERNAERSQSHDRAELPDQRGLPDPGSDLERAGAEAPGQIREDAEEVPAGASPRAVESDDPQRDPVPAPAGDRRDGESPSGTDAPGAGEGSGSDRGAEGQRPDGLGGPDEQLQGPGGGSDPERAGVRIIEAAEQISMFPSVAEQIESIAEAESAETVPSAFSVSQEDIDHLLRLGSNTEDARTKIALEFMKQKPFSELTASVKQTYHDGYGLKTESRNISSWAAEDGLHITMGTSVRYDRTAQILSWEDATARIGELLEQGRFATNVELTEAPGYELEQAANSLWYLCGDMSAEAREQGWLPTLLDNYTGAYPDTRESLQKLLEDREIRQIIISELEAFASAWERDRTLMRYRYYRPDRVLREVKELSLPRREYASDMGEIPLIPAFITEDEIDATLTRGGNVEGAAGRIYSFWQQEHTPREKADFLKNEYGTGGGNNAVSHNFHSEEDHSSKGIVLRKPDAEEVSLSWAKVTKRIDALVAKDRYLTPEAKAEWEQRQAENTIPTAAVNEYNAIKNAHPDEIVLFQVGDFFEMYGEDALAAAKLLDLHTTIRSIPGVGRVEKCGVPSHQLEFYLEQLRDTQDVVIASIETPDGKHVVREVPSIDHEAARAIDAHEAEFGADGYRAFPGDRPEPAQPPILKLTQEDIDQQLRTMFPDIETKRAVVRYMNEHGREKETAAWLASQYYGTDVSQPLHISYASREGQPGDEVILSWAKVQRRIAQLIKADKFYTQEEIDNLDDVDPVAIRERLAQAGIVNGEVVDPDALDHDPFIQQVMADAEQIAREEQPVEPDVFTTPGGRQYRVGEEYEARTSNGEVLVNVRIERVSEDAVSYSLPEKPDDAPIQLPRADFDQLMDEGRFTPVQTEQAQAIVSGPSMQGEESGADNQDNETDPVPEGRDTKPDSSAKERDFTPYHVGDTVYLEDTAYEITEIGDFDVQLRDPTQRYPIFRSENRRTFEMDLYRDRRNVPITDFLAADLDKISGYLRDALTWNGGLLDVQDKELVSKAFRGGDGNRRVAGFLSASFRDISKDMTMPSGDTGLLRGDVHALDIRVQNQGGSPLSISRTSWENIAPILRAMFQQDRYGFFRNPDLPEPEPTPTRHEETTAFYPGDRNGLPYDIEIRTLHTGEPEQEPSAPVPYVSPAENYRITDDHLGEGGPKAKFRANMDAINLLKELEFDGRQATPEEQETLSRYVGWGGLADAFDETKESWSDEFKELYATLTPEEYAAARASTLNAHYTTPTVIRAMYEAIGNMGFRNGNILEPSMGVGNFFGMLPENMKDSRLYGVELDSISGRIAKQLYPRASITVAGFETTDRRDFFDLAVGNVPFGNYQVDDRAYNKLGFSIHNYFFAKALDQVRPGGVVAFVTSRYTLDAKDTAVRKYLAQRAELLGAIRLPNNAFRANAGTDAVSDIIFLQKRDHPIGIEPEWVRLGQNDDGFAINSYFVDHPEMILGRQSSDSTQYGHQDFTVLPIEGLELGDQLHDAIQYIRGTYKEAELPDLGEGETVTETLPADPNVKNYSFTVVDGEVYYRENSIMVKPDLNATARDRVKGMVELRDCVRELIDLQMDEYTPDSTLAEKQEELNRLYDTFTAKYGLINDRGNRLAFADDDSYYLLCSLEVLDENGELERKADFFTKRTIKQSHSVDHVDTAVEALGVSIGEKPAWISRSWPPFWAGRRRYRRSWKTCGASCSKTRPPAPSTMPRTASIGIRAGRPPTNTFPATCAGNCGRRKELRNSTRSSRSTWKRCGKPSQRTWTLRRSKCVWAPPGSTSLISRSSCTTPSTRPSTCSGESRSIIPPTRRSGRSRARAISPITISQPLPPTARTGPALTGFWRMP